MILMVTQPKFTHLDVAFIKHAWRFTRLHLERRSDWFELCIFSVPAAGSVMNDIQMMLMLHFVVVVGIANNLKSRLPKKFLYHDSPCVFIINAVVIFAIDYCYRLENLMRLVLMLQILKFMLQVMQMIFYAGWAGGCAICFVLQGGKEFLRLIVFWWLKTHKQ